VIPSYEYELQIKQLRQQVSDLRTGNETLRLQVGKLRFICTLFLRGEEQEARRHWAEMNPPIKGEM
jgi:hypothetical protein